LVVSELVSNAVEHAPGSATYELEVVQIGSGVRISLADGSSIKPVVAELAHDRPRGRGMRIVEALTSSWGADDHDGGKRVWVELRGEPDDDA
jgi:two-component sensor histidine kinase